jgi:hypothetical protein
MIMWSDTVILILRFGKSACHRGGRTVPAPGSNSFSKEPMATIKAVLTAENRPDRENINHNEAKARM